MSPFNLLNPAAGDVPIPEDPREIDAARRAGIVSYRLFPYIEWRYGERGRRFTSSDSAWLAWLTRFDAERVYQEILWLRNVLSNRGMPGRILELHLSVLRRQLARAVPEHAARYQTLGVSAGRLREAREGAIPSRREQELVQEFVTALRGRPGFLLAGSARLITASVADESVGVKNAVTSLVSWLSDLPRLRELTDLRDRLGHADRRVLDRESFARSWKKAVESTVERARRKVTAGRG